MSEQLLNRLAQDRSRELIHEAASIRQLAVLRLGWRSRLARGLITAAERLEPSCSKQEHAGPLARV